MSSGGDSGWSVTLAAWLGIKTLYVAVASYLLACNLTTFLVLATVDFLGAFLAVL